MKGESDVYNIQSVESSDKDSEVLIPELLTKSEEDFCRIIFNWAYIAGFTTAISCILQAFSAVVFLSTTHEILCHTHNVVLFSLALMTGCMGFFGCSVMNYRIIVFRGTKRKRQFVTRPWTWAMVLLPMVLNISGCMVSYYNGTRCKYTSLSKTMELYREDEQAKHLLDKVQLLLQCCGENNFSDWFLVDWQGSDLEPKGKCGTGERDSVPFSCCAKCCLEPCIHCSLRIIGPERINVAGCNSQLKILTQKLLLMIGTNFAIAALFEALYLILVQKVITIYKPGIKKKSILQLAWEVIVDAVDAEEKIKYVERPEDSTFQDISSFPLDSSKPRSKKLLGKPGKARIQYPTESSTKASESIEPTDQLKTTDSSASTLSPVITEISETPRKTESSPTPKKKKRRKKPKKEDTAEIKERVSKRRTKRKKKERQYVVNQVQLRGNYFSGKELSNQSSPFGSTPRGVQFSEEEATITEEWDQFTNSGYLKSANYWPEDLVPSCNFLNSGRGRQIVIDNPRSGIASISPSEHVEHKISPRVLKRRSKM